MTFALPDFSRAGLGEAAFPAFAAWEAFLLEPWTRGTALFPGEAMSGPLSMFEAMWRSQNEMWRLWLGLYAPASADGPPTVLDQQAAAAPAMRVTKATVPLRAKSAPRSRKTTPSIDAAGAFDDDAVAKVAPKMVAKPKGKADDLIAIKGIGPKLSRLLNDLGVHHYRQIAEWTPGEIAWINDKLDFKGRVQRERWVAQARALVKGR